MDFNLSKEIAGLHNEDAWLRAGRNTKTLGKQSDLRIVLVALKAGKKLEEREAAREYRFKRFGGHVTLLLAGQAVYLPAGHLVALDRGIRHDVVAVKESAFLLTIS